jgi:hypothetical protein
MQAIITTYKPATNTRGSHILARCTRGSISAPYDHELDNRANHIAAAQALVNRFVKEDQLTRSEPPTRQPMEPPPRSRPAPDLLVCPRFRQLTTTTTLTTPCKHRNKSNPNILKLSPWRRNAPTLATTLKLNFGPVKLTLSTLTSGKPITPSPSSMKLLSSPSPSRSLPPRTAPSSAASPSRVLPLPRLH